MKDSPKPLVDVTVELPEDVLAKVEKFAQEKKLSIEDAIIFLIRVDSHQ